MEIPKPADADRERFRRLVPMDPRVEVRPMFGNLAALVDGNMFMGLFGPEVGVRLPEDDRRQLMEAEGAAPFGPPERPMKEYVALPAHWAATPSLARPWVELALRHAAALPPKRRSG